MRFFENVAYATRGDAELLLDVYVPDGACSSVFVFFHGGGLENGSKASAQRFAQDLAERGIATVSVEYRMYPTAKYPDFLIDCAESVAWVKNNIRRFADDVEKIFVGGSSAGAYISMMLAFDKRRLAPHGITPTDIDGYIHNAGQPTCHFRTLAERGIDSRRVIIDESAPLYHIGTEDNVSPMLIIVSDDDMKGRYEQTMLTLSALDHFGLSDTLFCLILRLFSFVFISGGKNLKKETSPNTFYCI